MQAAGCSATPHLLQFNRLLAVPMLFAAMVLLAATFSLRPQRRGRVGAMILTGMLTGFLLYFLSNFVFAIGLSGTIPVVLAAWRSEEHTSELQSLMRISYAVFCLKKTTKKN